MSRTSELSPAYPMTASGAPLFPLNAVLFPGGPLPLRIFEPRYVDMVRLCMRQRCPFGVLLIQSGPEVGAEGGRHTSEIGTTARIVDFDTLPDGLLGITCIGERRFRVRKRWQQANGLHLGDIEFTALEERLELPGEYLHLGELLRRVLPEFGELYASVPKHFADAAWVGYRLAEILPISLSEKQFCLELDDPLARLARLSPLIRKAEE
ncbi:MAG TPA: LON peptidase substrate-binding domain-containing protein [Steroidobacteraceae bacterium]|nr:LON peptidase substrate-binding domain-containing protein [Steroidobacteraceae bacterium]